MAESAREPATAPDWTVQAADAIESVVDTIRAKTTIPATTVARTVVYGLVVAVMGTAALVLFAVGLVRALDAYLPEDVWAAHLVAGMTFTVPGVLLLRKASRPRSHS